MSGVVFNPDNAETRYKFNQLSRHHQIHKLYRDILCDLEVCELEGWDKTEYVNDLYKILDHFRQVMKKERKDGKSS